MASKRKTKTAKPRKRQQHKQHAAPKETPVVIAVTREPRDGFTTRPA